MIITQLIFQENSQNERLIQAFIVESLESEFSLRAEEVYIHQGFDNNQIELLMLFLFGENIPSTVPREMKTELGFFTFNYVMLDYQSKAKTAEKKAEDFLLKYPFSKKFERFSDIIPCPEDDFVPPFEQIPVEKDQESDILAPSFPQEYDMNGIGTAWKIRDDLYCHFRQDIASLENMQRLLDSMQTYDEKILEESLTFYGGSMEILRTNEKTLDKEIKKAQDLLIHWKKIALLYQKHFGLSSNLFEREN